MPVVLLAVGVVGEEATVVALLENGVLGTSEGLSWEAVSPTCSWIEEPCWSVAVTAAWKSIHQAQFTIVVIPLQ